MSEPRLRTPKEKGSSLVSLGMTWNLLKFERKNPALAKRAKVDEPSKAKGAAPGKEREKQPSPFARNDIEWGEIRA
jgi:hypothetical protein